MVDLDDKDDIMSGTGTGTKDSSGSADADDVTFTQEEVNALLTKRLGREKSKTAKELAARDAQLGVLSNKLTQLEAVLSKLPANGVAQTEQSQPSNKSIADLLKESGVLTAQPQQQQPVQPEGIPKIVEKALFRSAKSQFKALGVSGDDLEDALESLKLKKIDISADDFDEDDLEDEVNRVYNKFFKKESQTQTVKTGVKTGKQTSGTQKPDLTLSRQDRLSQLLTK